MTTPTQPRAVSTPKAHLPNTPSRMMASPRPGTGTLAGKTLAYKSPMTAMKTPASNYSHLHGLSASSQPSSTPLAAAAIHDELLNLNSPAAALINSIAQNNLTPLPHGQDSLGMPAHTPLGTREGPKNPETERLHSVQQAIDQLKSSILGRGVTRAGIERLAKLHGLDVHHDDSPDTSLLVLAGKSETFELEITFDNIVRDNVNDLSLKLFYNNDEHVQDAGTVMLKSQLGAHGQAVIDPSRSLRSFALNVEYLAELDRIKVTPNCFQLVNNLSACLHDIWQGEKKRMHWRNDLHHLRKGAFGRPTMDRAPSLGLNIGYWQKESMSGKDSDNVGQDTADCTESSETRFHAKISCEEGDPAMMATDSWLTPDILTEGQPGQNVLDAKDHVFHPEWRNSAAGLAIKMHDTKDEASMELDKKVPDLPQPLNVHFTCTLNAEVFVPLSVLSRLNSEFSMVDVDPRKAITYHQVLQRRGNTSTAHSLDTVIEDRWKRRLPQIDRKGQVAWREQSYKLYASSQDTNMWCYPISRTKFSHPRQLADLISILRMHIVVWALLESIGKPSAQSKSPVETTPEPLKRKTVRRSNKHPRDALSTVNVDISIDFMSSSIKTTIEIFAPLRVGTGLKLKASMLHLVVQVGLNGAIEVTGAYANNDSDLPGLRSKLGKMLTASEDIGMVVQWLLARAEEG